MDPLKRIFWASLTCSLILSTLSAQALVRPLLAVAGDGSVFAVTTPEGDIHVRDVMTGELIAQRSPHNRSLRTISFSSDPSELNVRGDAESSGSWNWRTGRWVPRSFRVEAAEVLVQTPRLSVTAGKRGIEARDAATKSLVWKVLDLDEVLSIYAVGERWAAATASGRVVWGRLSDGVIEQSWSPGHGPVVAVAGTKGQRWIVLSADFSLALWEGIQGQKLGSFEL